MENKVIGGWLPDRVDEEDYLYILDITSENERYIKIGRSITPERRYKSYRRSGWDVKVIGEIKDTHEFIFFLEQSLLDKFKTFKRKPTNLVKGLYKECLDFEVYPQIEHFLDRENAA